MSLLNLVNSEIYLLLFRLLNIYNGKTKIGRTKISRRKLVDTKIGRYENCLMRILVEI